MQIKNSSIFQTNSDNTGIITLLQARKLAEQELTSTIQQKQAVLATDKVALKMYEAEVAKGTVSTERFATIMQGASVEAQKYAVSTQGATGSTQAFVSNQQKTISAMQKTEKASLSASIGVKALSIAGNMLAFMVIAKGIELAATAIDNYIHRVEKANEAMEKAVSTYDSTKSSLESINSELETQNNKIAELQAKDKLTYAEKGQLEELQNITKELLIQQNIEERNAENASKEVAEKTVDAYDKQYDRYDITKDNLNDKFEHVEWSGMFPVSEGTDDVTGNIAAYIRSTELLTDAQNKYNEAVKNGENTEWLGEDVQRYIDMSDNYRDMLDSNLSDLQDKKIALESEYNKAIEKQSNGIEPLTTVQSETIESYEKIADIIRLIYEYTDSNKWNSVQIESVFNSDNIEKTKDELIEMAKAGTLTEDELKKYPNLMKEIDGADFLGESTSNIQAFCDEMYAVSDSIANAQSSTLNETPISFDYKNLEGLESKLSSIQSAFDTVTSAMNEFNDQGFLNMSTIDSLLSLDNAYINALVDENGQINYNSESFKNLAKVKIEEAKASVYQEACTELARIKELDTALAAQELAFANGTLTQSAYDTAQALYEEVVAMGGANAALGKQVWNSAAKKVALLDNQLKSVTSSTYNFSKASSSASKKAETNWKDILDKEIKAQQTAFEAELIDFGTYINKRKSLIDGYYQSGKIKAADYYSELHDMYEAELGTYDKVLSAVNRRYQKEIDKIQDTIDGIEKQNDILQSQIDNYGGILSAIDDVYNSEIDRLKEQQDSIQQKIDSLNDEADAYDLIKRKEEALYALRRAQEQRTQRVYTSDKGVIYTQNNEDIRAAQDNLNDINNEEIISKLEKEKEYLDQDIESLEKYRDLWSQITSAKETETNLQLAISLYGQDFEKIILNNRLSDIENFKNNYIEIQNQLEDNQSLIDSNNEKIEYYNQLKEQWASISDAYKNSVEDQYATMVLGATWESDIVNGRLDVMNQFRNEYIAIQQSIADAAWNSANAQIAAAKEAQKASNGSSGGAGSVGSSNGSITKPSVTNNKTDWYDPVTKKHGSGTPPKNTGHNIMTRYGTGTTNAKPGYHRVGDGGDEIILDNYGNAVMTSGETIYPFEGGEHVIKSSESESLLKNASNMVSLEELFPANTFLQNMPDISNMIMNNFNVPTYDYGNIIQPKNQEVTVHQDINVTIPNLDGEAAFHKFERGLEQMKLDAVQRSYKR